MPGGRVALVPEGNLSNTFEMQTESAASRSPGGRREQANQVLGQAPLKAPRKQQARLNQDLSLTQQSSAHGHSGDACSRQQVPGAHSQKTEGTAAGDGQFPGMLSTSTGEILPDPITAVLPPKRIRDGQICATRSRVMSTSANRHPVSLRAWNGQEV